MSDRVEGEVSYHMVSRGDENHTVTLPGMIAYTRRRLATGEVRIFLRHVDGRVKGQIVLSTQAAAKIKPNVVMAFRQSR